MPEQAPGAESEYTMAILNLDCVDGTGTDDDILYFRGILPYALRVHSVGDMVRRLEERLNPACSDGRSRHQLHRLRIFAHGNSGAQGLGNSYYGAGTAYL